MCNINIIFNKRKIETKLIADYMNAVSWESWKMNKDGEGYIGISNRGVEIKRNTEKIRYKESFWFLSTHQRLATSGRGESNIHPHETKHLILQHNGIFTGMGTVDKSDTSEYKDMLEKAYVKYKKDIVKAIQKVSKKVNGTYSIVVYEKLTGKVYYFKERGTSMYCLRNKKWVMLSTKKENLEYARFFFGIQKKIKEIRPYVIVDMLNNFSVIGKFEDADDDVITTEYTNWPYRQWHHKQTHLQESIDVKTKNVQESALEARSKQDDFYQAPRNYYAWKEKYLGNGVRLIDYQ